MASWRSGDAADCKSVYTGSIPVLASRFTYSPFFINHSLNSDFISFRSVRNSVRNSVRTIRKRMLCQSMKSQECNIDLNQKFCILGYAQNQRRGDALKYLTFGKTQKDGFGTVAQKYID